MKQSPSFWVIAGSVFLALAALSATLISLPPHDLWWQLRIGQIVAHERQIPTVERLSYTARGEPWLAQEWLAGLIFYALQSVWGLDSIAWLRIALMVGVTACIAAAGMQRGARGLTAMAGAALCLWAIRPWLAMRPQLFTYALMVVTLWILEAARRGRRPALLLPLLPMTVVWANLHAGALLAPALLAAETVGAGIDAARARYASHRLSEPEAEWQWAGWLALMMVGVLIATLLTPHGFALWSYPGKVTGHPIVTNFITEWKSPDFHGTGLRPVALLMGLLMAALIASGPRPPFRDFLLLAALLSMGMMYKRNLPLFALVACPILVGRVSELLMASGWDRRIRWDWAGIAACLLSLPLLSGALRQWPSGDLFASQAGMGDFPVGAVRYLQENPPPGPLFNEYRWGGYLIWHLPQVPVFIDGRAEVYYRRGVFDDYVRVHRFQPGWREVLDRYGIQTVLMENGMGVAQALSADPNWWAVYRDRQAVVLVRGPLPRTSPFHSPQSH